MKSLIDYILESQNDFKYTYASWRQLFDEIWEGEDWNYISHDLTQYDYPFITTKDNKNGLKISEIKKLYNDDKTELLADGRIEDNGAFNIKYKGKIYTLNVPEEE